MSKDPLALSVITAGLPHETEYDAVYAAVTATERGRWFLTEFANRNRHADTESVVAALARIEVGLSSATPRPSAAIGQELKAIAAAVAQIRVTIGGDITGVVERIHDIAFSLRERAADVELCNALDAALRDISGSRPRELVNGNGAHTAAQLLDNLAIRIDDLIKLSQPGEPAGEGAQKAQPQLSQDAAEAIADNQADTEDAAPADASGRSHPAIVEFELRRKPSLPVADLALSLADAASAIGPQSASSSSVMPSLDDDTGQVEASEPQAETPMDDGPRWHIEAPEFFFQPAASAEMAEEAAPGADESRPHALLPGAELAAEPDDDLDDIFESAAPAVEMPPQSINGADSATVTAASQSDRLRVAPSDLFAALRGLSEDELNALFG